METDRAYIVRADRASEHRFGAPGESPPELGDYLAKGCRLSYRERFGAVEAQAYSTAYLFRTLQAVAVLLAEMTMQRKLLSK